MGNILDKVVARVLDPVIQGATREVSYLVYYSENIHNLQVKLEELEDEWTRLHGRVERDRNNARVIEEDVRRWLKKAHGIKVEVDGFLKENEDTRYWGCFKLQCPNLYSRFGLGREAKKKIELVIGLIDSGRNFREISHRQPHGNDVGSLMPWSNYVHFGSRGRIYEQIMEALRDDTVNIVGIWGMPGVGKTIMKDEVKRQSIEARIFDEVAETVVTENLNVENIQVDIAVSLNLKLASAQNEVERAARLASRLKNGKKVLVILDDVWGKLDMKKIGIQFPDGINGCKILLTSRRRDICVDNQCLNPFQIEVLNKEEAWDLFKKKVGNSICELPSFHPLAKEVCEECGGLPLVIDAVGAALKDKEEAIWQDALEQFRNSTPQNIGGMDPKVYVCLELSFNQLIEEDARSCLLLCSLFREDAEISIHELARLAKGTGLLQNLDKLEKARNRIISMVKILKNSSLLLDGDNGSVKMHDLIRDLAIFIASKYDKYAFLVKSGVSEWPEADVTKKVISLRSENINEVPGELDCPELHTLMLYCGYVNKLGIPDSFFNGLEKLMVLSLRGVNLSSLPSSLRNLRMLSLKWCKVADISFLKELKKLEMLSLGDIGIEVLPLELQQLTRLRLLDLRNCDNLNVIPPQILSNLSHLEELYLPDEFSNSGNDSIILAELSSLTHLTALEIHILNVMLFPDEKLCEKLLRFKISVGHFELWSLTADYKFLSRRSLSLNGISQLKGGVKILMERAEELILRNSKGLQKIFTDSDREGFGDLTHLEIDRCDDLEYLIGQPKSLAQNHRQLQPGSFSKLSVLVVYRCQLIKYLFCASIARGLVQLQKLIISDCNKMEEIIRDDSQVQTEEGTSQINFHQLRYLRLSNLPSLTSFCAKMRNMSATMGNPSTPPAQSLFNGKVSFPALENLDIHTLNSTEIWEKQTRIEDHPESFCKLRILQVTNLDLLKHVIPSTMVQRLQNLEELTVHYCKSVTSAITPLPRLRKLTLKGLPKLTQTLWNSKELSLGIPLHSNLECLHISFCDNLKTVFAPRNCVHLQELSIEKCEKMVEIIAEVGEESDDEIAFSSLKVLKLENLKSFWACRSVEHKEKAVLHEVEPSIIQHQSFFKKVAFPSLEELKLTVPATHWGEIRLAHGSPDSVSKLRKLHIEGYIGVSAVVSPNWLIRLQNLKTLEVIGCEKLRELFDLTGVEGDVGLLPVLDCLHLENLPELHCLWNKDPHGILSFQCLTSVEIIGCGLLRNLFSCSVARAFQQLVVLVVDSCPMMEEIVTDMTGDHDDDEIVFPRLSIMYLWNLPKLTSFCSAKCAFNMPSLGRLELEGCQNFTFGQLSIPSPTRMFLKRREKERMHEDSPSDSSNVSATSTANHAHPSTSSQESRPDQVGASVCLKSTISSTEIVAEGVVESINPSTQVGGEELGPNWCEVSINSSCIETE